MKKPKSIKINPIKVERSRRLVSMAIEELIQSGAAPELSRQLCGLRGIEDVLWQYSTALRVQKGDYRYGNH